MLSGREFNVRYGHQKLCKLTDRFTTRFVEGLNVDGCGLTFTTETHLHKWVHCAIGLMYYAFMVKIPDDAIVELVDNGSYKTNQLILSQKQQIWNTLRLCMRAIRGNGGHLAYVQPDLKTSKMELIAVQQNSWAILFVRELTPELCLEALKKDMRMLWWISRIDPPKWLSDIYLEIVRHNGLDLSHIRKEKRTYELCEEAVHQNVLALKHVPRKIRKLLKCA